MHIFDILAMLVEHQGSDIHIICGTQPTLRIDGVLLPIEGSPVLVPEQAEALILPLLNLQQREQLRFNLELDFGFQFQDKGRFRINVYQQRGTMAAAMRLIPAAIKSIDDLQLPAIFHDLTKYKQGLVLVTGPTGEGKSTT